MANLSGEAYGMLNMALAEVFDGVKAPVSMNNFNMHAGIVNDVGASLEAIAPEFKI